MIEVRSYVVDAGVKYMILIMNLITKNSGNFSGESSPGNPIIVK